LIYKENAQSIMVDEEMGNRDGSSQSAWHPHHEILPIFTAVDGVDSESLVFVN